MSFAPTDAAFEGFRIVREKPGLVLAWAGFYFVALLAMIAVLLIGLGPKLMTLAPVVDAGSGRDLDQLKERFGIPILLVIPMAMVMMTMLTAAVYRAVLRPDDTGFFYLRFGADELRLLALNIIIVGLAALLSAVYGAAVIWLSRAVGDALGGALTVLGTFGGALLAVWVAVRMSLAAPIAFAERRIRLLGAWQETRGRFWPLLTMWLLTVLAVFVLILLAAVTGAGLTWALGGFTLLREVTHEAPSAISRGDAIGLLLQLVLQMAIQVLGVVLLSVIAYASPARGYQRIARHP